MVATALGTARRPRDEWVSFDVVNQNGDQIEVKSAAYRQSWAQDRPSNIQFRIAPTHWLWNPETGDNKELDPPRRTAKIYVFCVLGRKAEPSASLSDDPALLAGTPVPDSSCPMPASPRFSSTGCRAGVRLPTCRGTAVSPAPLR